jgi:hypothetical protein
VIDLTSPRLDPIGLDFVYEEIQIKTNAYEAVDQENIENFIELCRLYGHPDWVEHINKMLGVLESEYQQEFEAKESTEALLREENRKEMMLHNDIFERNV